MLKLFSVLTIGNSAVNKQVLLSIGRIRQVYSTASGVIVEYVKNWKSGETVPIKLSSSETESGVRAKMIGYVAGTGFTFAFTWNGIPRVQSIQVDSILWGFGSTTGSTVFYEVSNVKEAQQYLSTMTVAQLLNISNATSIDYISIEGTVGTETAINGESGGVVKALDVVPGSLVRFIISRKSALAATDVTVTGTLIKLTPDTFTIPAGQTQYLYEKEVLPVDTGTHEVSFLLAEAGGTDQEISFTFAMVNTNPVVVLNDITDEGAGDFAVDIDFTNAYPYEVVADVNTAKLQSSVDGVAGWVDVDDIEMGDGVTAPYTDSQNVTQALPIDIALYYRIVVKDNADTEFYSNVFSYPTAVTLNSIVEDGDEAADFDVSYLHAYEMTAGVDTVQIQVSDDGLADWTDVVAVGLLPSADYSANNVVTNVAIEWVDGKFYRVQVKDVDGNIVSSDAVQFVAVSSVTINAISSVGAIDATYDNAFEVTPATLDASIDQSDDGLGGWVTIISITLPSNPFTGMQVDDLAAELVDGKFYRVAIKNIVGADFYSAAVEFTAQVTSAVLAISDVGELDIDLVNGYEVDNPLLIKVQQSDDGLAGWADAFDVTIPVEPYTGNVLDTPGLTDGKFYRVNVLNYAGATISSNVVEYIEQVTTAVITDITDIGVIEADYVNAYEMVAASLEITIQQSDDGLAGWVDFDVLPLPGNPFTGSQGVSNLIPLVDTKFYRLQVKDFDGDTISSNAVEFVAQVTTVVLNSIDQTTGTDTTVDADFSHAWEMNPSGLDYNLQVSDDGLAGWVDVEPIENGIDNNDYTEVGAETVFALVIVDTKYYRIQVKNYAGVTVSSNAFQYNL